MPLRMVDLHPLAIREAQGAYRWYARRTPSSAQRFQAAFRLAIQRIEASAEQGNPYGPSYRWFRLRRFPYLLYYKIRDPQPVLIYAVAHASRRPGYWLRRARP